MSKNSGKAVLNPKPGITSFVRIVRWSKSSMISQPVGSAAKRHDLPSTTCPFRALASPCPHRHSLAEPTPAPNSAMGRDPLSFSSQKKFVPHLQAEKMDHPSFRMLALAALAFMIARPMTGGFPFLFLVRKPRSTRARARSFGKHGNKDRKGSSNQRAKALDAFQAFAEPWTESRLVVIDTALEDPFFIDKAASVKDAALERFFGPTDTSADLPGTCQKLLTGLKNQEWELRKFFWLPICKSAIGTSTEIPKSWRKSTESSFKRRIYGS